MKEPNNVMTVKQWRKRADLIKATSPKPAKNRAKAKTQEPYKDRTKYKIKVGIDTGTNTGCCVFSNKIDTLDTLPIHKALTYVSYLVGLHGAENILVRLEDARLRTWYGEDKRGEKKKGAGSVERDCAIWEDFLKDIGVDYDRVHPRDVKATTPEQFKALTGYSGRTSIHAREAAWMVI